MDYNKWKHLLAEYESADPETHLTAFLRLRNYGELRYTPESRTYIVSSECPIFRKEGGRELYGSAYDGTCEELRLDTLIEEETPGAPTGVEACAIALYELLAEDPYDNTIEARCFADFAAAKAAMIAEVARKAKLDHDATTAAYKRGYPLYRKGVYEVAEGSATVTDEDARDWSWHIKEVLIRSEKKFRETIKTLPLG